MKRELTKAQRRRLSDLAGIAYERDLSQELARVEAAFEEWRDGKLDAFELSDVIHRFHQGPSRKLYSKYDHSNLGWAVADAIHRDVITVEEAGTEMLDVLAAELAWLRELGVCLSKGVGARSARRRERKEPNPKAYPLRYVEGSATQRSRMHRASQPHGLTRTGS